MRAEREKSAPDRTRKCLYYQETDRQILSHTLELVADVCVVEFLAPLLLEQLERLDQHR